MLKESFNSFLKRSNILFSSQVDVNVDKRQMICHFVVFSDFGKDVLSSVNLRICLFFILS